jgi:hypothetical protein
MAMRRGHSMANETMALLRVATVTFSARGSLAIFAAILRACAEQRGRKKWLSP